MLLAPITLQLLVITAAATVVHMADTAVGMVAVGSKRVLKTLI
jgi:hypothetical protein